MAKSWNDERLEERFDAIDRRFDGVDQRLDGIDHRLDRVEHRLDRVGDDIRDLRGDMNARFDLLNSSFNERFDRMNADVNARFEKVTERLEAMHRLMVQGGIVIIAALLGVIATFAGVFATQL